MLACSRTSYHFGYRAISSRKFLHSHPTFEIYGHVLPTKEVPKAQTSPAQFFSSIASSILHNEVHKQQRTRLATSTRTTISVSTLRIRTKAFEVELMVSAANVSVARRGAQVAFAVFFCLTCAGIIFGFAGS